VICRYKLAQMKTSESVGSEPLGVHIYRLQEFYFKIYSNTANYKLWTSMTGTLQTQLVVFICAYLYSITCTRKLLFFYFPHAFDFEPNVEYFLLKNQYNICCKASLSHVDLDCSKTPQDLQLKVEHGGNKKTKVFLYK
jgi:hypothetical protein